jgi:hypothetical protein
MVLSQDNRLYGIHFKTDGINWGPRCNKILGNDSEANDNYDIKIDGGTLPLTGPGGYNVILGTRSVAISPRIKDDSTGSLVLYWTPHLDSGAYVLGKTANVLNMDGQAGYTMAVGTNLAPARIYAEASGTTNSILKASVHKFGTGPTDGWVINQNAVFQPQNELALLPYSPAISIDAAFGHIFQINADNGTAFTINTPSNPTAGQTIKLLIRNTSGGALGAITWGAGYKKSAFTAPAPNNSRSISFVYDGASWIETDKSGVDVPN